MKKLLLTGWYGNEHRDMLDITGPLMRKYAEKHDYDYSEIPFSTSGDRTITFEKLPCILQKFRCGYDVILWMDADIVIVRSDIDISTELPDNKILALVEHVRTCHGQDERIPNSGIMLMRPQCVPFLDDAYNMEDLLHHEWGDQAGLQKLLGCTTSFPYHFNRITRLYTLTEWLPLYWNSIPFDQDVNPRFVHVSYIGDRAFRYNQLKLAAEKSDLR